MIMLVLMIDFDKIINLKDSVDVEVITNVFTSLNVLRSKIRLRGRNVRSQKLDILA